MSSSSVQFKGLDSVMQAFENRGLQHWSIWQGKQFLFPHVGESIETAAAALQDTLELLAESSNAIYTLKVYEEVPGGKIKSNTPDDGSFNFKLNDDRQSLTQAQYSAVRNNNAVMERLEAIEQRLSGTEDDDDPDKEAIPGMGQLGNILTNPAIQPLVMEFITKLLTPNQKPAPAPQMQPRPAAINGVTDELQANIELNNAIVILKQHDPKLPEHLTKLAKIATGNPATFQFLLTTIDKM